MPSQHGYSTCGVVAVCLKHFNDVVLVDPPRWQMDNQVGKGTKKLIMIALKKETNKKLVAFGTGGVHKIVQSHIVRLSGWGCTRVGGTTRAATHFHRNARTGMARQGWRDDQVHRSMRNVSISVGTPKTLQTSHAAQLKIHAMDIVGTRRKVENLCYVLVVRFDTGVMNGTSKGGHSVVL